VCLPAFGSAVLAAVPPLALSVALSVALSAAASSAGAATATTAQGGTHAPQPPASAGDAPADAGGTPAPLPNHVFSIGPSIQKEQLLRRDQEKGTLLLIGTPLRVLCAQAFGVHPRDVLAAGEADAPDLDARFDVLIQPRAGRNDRLAGILARGLARELGLRFDFEQPEVEVDVLRRKAGAAPPSASHAAKPSADAGDGHLRASGLPVRELVGFARWRNPRPILDETGLTGRYDWEIDWDATGGASAFSAALASIGLELTTERRPFRFLVVYAAPEG